jgi:CheY-like chemotaxis protein
MQKILIVGSSPVAVERDRTILNRATLRLFTARTVQDALALHRREKMDVIVLDFYPAFQETVEMIRAVRGDTLLKKVSLIVICSGREGEVEQSLSAGANVCLTRPVGAEFLQQKVSALLEVPERRSFRVLISVKVEGRAEAAFFFCTSHNISTAGILLETDHPLTVGSPLAFSFYLKGGKVGGEGMVVRMVQKRPGLFQYGIKFTQMDMDSLRLIERYVGENRNHPA